MIYWEVYYGSEEESVSQENDSSSLNHKKFQEGKNIYCIGTEAVKLPQGVKDPCFVLHPTSWDV